MKHYIDVISVCVPMHLTLLSDCQFIVGCLYQFWGWYSATSLLLVNENGKYFILFQQKVYIRGDLQS
jgi:hypothetical protein